MALKTKIENLGLTLMAASATLLLVEVPERNQHKVVVPNQPAFAMAENINLNYGHDFEQRRERDEVHPHYHGYSVSQRTPARSGRA